MIKVNSDVSVFEVDGVEQKMLVMPTISVQSHWVRSELVVLVVDGNHLTVSAKDLRAAVDNATNSAKV